MNMKLSCRHGSFDSWLCSSFNITDANRIADRKKQKARSRSFASFRMTNARYRAWYKETVSLDIEVI